MKKKEIWMKKGNAVLADGKPGVIKSMEENTIDGVEYVYYINVVLNGHKKAGTYHPGDISEIQPAA
jgi:hypothetical protein